MTSGKVVTTIGYERRYNDSLKFTDEQAFVRHMLVDQPARPANMGNIVAINMGRKPYSMELAEVPLLSVEETVSAMEREILVVDTRSPKEFGAGHLPGAYHVDVGSKSFEQSVGWVLPTDHPFLLFVADAAAAGEAARKLAFVGLDGSVRGAVEANGWGAAGKPLNRVAQVDVHSVADEVRQGRTRLLDVREAAEWNAGHVATAVRMSFKTLPDRWQDLDLDPTRRVAVICASGGRSSTACSVLRNRGFTDVCNVEGGMEAWSKADLPLV